VARRSGLGRGLDAILPAEGAVPEDGVALGGDGFVQWLPVDEIRPNPYQPRRVFDDAALAELTASIEAVGVLQPVLVRPTPRGYQLVAGERRWRASRAAGLETIPALVRDTEEIAALAQAVIENVQRADLNPIEEAAAYQQLIAEFSLTQDDVATRVGRSRSAVANTLRLLQLSPEIQRMVLDSSLSAGHARALLGTIDLKLRVALAERAVEEQLSVRQLEALVKEHDPAQAKRSTERAAPGTTKPAALLELEQLLSDRLATRVHLQLGRKKGRIEIEFADLEDLERIYRILS
jgi:ParB family transcriptional regulator, chromosome partitioning protein